ncbi:MAG: ATP-binding cassette domain-containing protein, partial [Planctomycetota bacterium]
LHAIAGLTEIDEGTICVEGQKLTGLSDAQLTRFRRERVGLVFQAFNLIPTLTARDNIRLPVLSDPMRSANADRLLRELGLADRGGHRPDELSGGEQQRVAIARALICDPAIVLLDEPTGSLDSVAGRELCVLLRRLSDQSRRTVVVVTHEPAVACWAGRVVVLKDGQVVDSFPTDAYQNAETLAQRYQAALEAQADCQA